MQNIQCKGPETPRHLRCSRKGMEASCQGILNARKGGRDVIREQNEKPIVKGLVRQWLLICENESY